jgi:hypothetical protein
MSVSRNAPCPCGSGLKYKRCCFGKEQQVVSKKGRLYLALYLVVTVVLGVGVGIGFGWESGLGAAGAALLLGGILYVVRSPPPSSGKSGDASDINFGR